MKFSCYQQKGRAPSLLVYSTNQYRQIQLTTYCLPYVKLPRTPNHYTFTLKMATAVLVETLANSQRSTQLILKSHSYTRTKYSIFICCCLVKIVITMRTEVSPDHQAVFSQTVREVFSPSLHLSAASQPPRLPSLAVSKPLPPSVSVSSAVGGVPWQLGHGARGSPVSRGRKSAAASPAGSQQQVFRRLFVVRSC